MYLFVTATLEWPASVLMTIAGALFVASREQNVCRSACHPVTRSPALFCCLASPVLMVVSVHLDPSPQQKTRFPLRCRIALQDTFSEVGYAHEIAGDGIPLLALAQHFGLPTSLLDWTRIAMKAAYFAAADLNIRDGEARLAVWRSRRSAPRTPL